MKIPAKMDSCIICHCDNVERFHISIKGECFEPGMSEFETTTIYKWLVYNDFVDTIEVEAQ